MSKKVKKDDAAELERAQNVPDEARADAVVDASAAGAGQADEAEAGDAAGGDEKPADAAAAGEVPGAADADAHAANDAQPEAAGEAEAELDHVHVPADYEMDSPFSVGDRVQLIGAPEMTGVVAEILPGGRVEVRWDDRERTQANIEEVRLLEDGAAGPPKNRIEANAFAAYSAASIAYGTTDEDATTLPRFDVGWLGGRGDRELAAKGSAAATFLRRDTTILVQPETLVIHLRRAGFADTPDATGRVAVAWKIFAFTLAEFDALDRAATEAKRRSEADACDSGPRPALRADLTMAPADPSPLTDLGKRLQARG